MHKVVGLTFKTRTLFTRMAPWAASAFETYLAIYATPFILPSAAHCRQRKTLCRKSIFATCIFKIQFFIYLPTYFWETNYQTAIFRQLFFSFFPFKSIFCSNWIFTIAIAEIICVVTALWSVQCFEEALEDFCPINHRKILLQQKVGHFTFIHIAENISKTTFSESFLKWSKVKLSCCI